MKVLKMLMAAFCCFAVAASCSDGLDESVTARIEGFVRNDLDKPVNGAVISLEGTGYRTVADETGFYSLPGVPVQDYTVKVEAEGYSSVTKKMFSTLFVRGVAYVDIVCAETVSLIGYVYDSGTVYSETEKVPLAGAKVRLGSRETTTAEDGSYSFTGLSVKTYTLTFEAEGYKDYSKEVTVGMFRNGDGTAIVPDMIFWRKLFPGFSFEDLKELDCWYADEYRGGRQNSTAVESMYHSFMSAMDIRGTWENQTEGTTLRSVADNSKPVNRDDFESYLIGRKRICEGNRILTLRCRTHNASESDPVVFGVQIVDLDSSAPMNTVVGEKNITLNNNTSNYSDISFDLSEYVGHEIAISIGIFRTSNATKQFVIRKITFAPKAVSGAASYAGDAGTAIEGLEGWHISKEMVASMMVNDNVCFTALPGSLPSDAAGDNVIKNTADGYKAWRQDKDHFMHSWAFNYVSWVPQPYAGAGFIMRTKHGGTVDKKIPVSYVYTKFPVAQGQDRLHFVMRTVQRDKNMANPAYLKFVAVTEDGVAKTLYPAEGSKGFEQDPVYRFERDGDSDLFVINSNNTGGAENYANVYYDLSEFDGRNVVVILAMFHGENVDDKAADGARMAIRNITLE
ncbi:MAG: carboxypeptidase regulatory-like domain-containing protein [Candidatus Cryptobacteroides sp.]